MINVLEELTNKPIESIITPVKQITWSSALAFILRLFFYRINKAQYSFATDEAGNDSCTSKT